MAPSRTPQTEISPTEHLPGSTPGRAPAAPRRIPPSRTASRAAQVRGTSPILETDASQHEALRGSAPLPVVGRQTAVLSEPGRGPFQSGWSLWDSASPLDLLGLSPEASR